MNASSGQDATGDTVNPEHIGITAPFWKPSRNEKKTLHQLSTNSETRIKIPDE